MEARLLWRLLSQKMNSATHVQILNETEFHFTNVSSLSTPTSYEENIRAD